MSDWDDRQYLKFSDERTRPARELLSRVPVDGAALVVDLGCGPGNSTALLRDRWPSARVLGVDTSREMLARARADLPDVEWLEADAGTFRSPAPADVLFANAVLHWLPDHARLIPSLFDQVRPGGALAIQVPDNLGQPSHRLMRALDGPWAARTRAVPERTSIETTGRYYDLLAPYARSIDLWRTTYEHVMVDAAAIVEWLKGSGLRPYLDALDEPARAAYLDAYTRAIAEAYPARADGRRLFSFPRLFLVAVR